MFKRANPPPVAPKKAGSSTILTRCYDSGLNVVIVLGVSVNKAELQSRLDQLSAVA